MPKAFWFIAGFSAACVLLAFLAMGPLSDARAVVSTPPPTALPTSSPEPSTPPTPVPTNYGLTLLRQGDLTGKCDRLSLDEAQTVYYAPCDQGQRLGFMTEGEQQRLSADLNRFGSFVYAVQQPAGSYSSMTVRLEFHGRGNLRATGEEQAQIARWAGALCDRLLHEEQRADLVAQARLHLAQRLGISADDIIVQAVLDKVWPDACLGIHQEGLFCASVLTPGYQIVLQVDTAAYEYRTDLHGLMRAVEEQVSSN